MKHNGVTMPLSLAWPPRDSAGIRGSRQNLAKVHVVSGLLVDNADGHLELRIAKFANWPVSI
jgi:hypothetical protein